jgi:serine/threonine protein phosphatase PrpC
MSFKSYVLSDKGLKRHVNEDSYLKNEDDDIYLVADGMGGYEKGDIASNIIVNSVNNIIKNHRLINITNEKHLPSIVQDAIEDSTIKIKKYCEDNQISSKIGSTLVGIYKHKKIKDLAYFHLGDSRLYKIRNHIIKQLTKDHTVYEEKKNDSLCSKEELSKIKKSQLSKAIGNFESYKIDLKYTDLKDEDIFLLCSDGIYNFIFEEELMKFILEYPFEKALELIKETIYSRGAKDNLTLIITQYKI